VNHLVLSGTRTIVPSGTLSSCHRGPKSEPTVWHATIFRSLNFTNWESFGFLLTEIAAPASRDVGEMCQRVAGVVRAQAPGEFLILVRSSQRNPGPHSRRRCATHSPQQEGAHA
jgi:hypothetical protein